MPPLRIGFDMDGVIADFALAYRGVEMRLFGQASSPADAPEVQAAAEDAAVEAPPATAAAAEVDIHEQRRRRDAIWAAIHETRDFWTSLAPLDPQAVPRIHEMMLRHQWEVFFITQRPSTAGETVQRQTQRWLHRHGFDLPSVLVIAGSRGGAAAAVRLDYHVDDSPQNCMDVAADSRAHPILIHSDRNRARKMSAARLGITVAASIGEALDLLEAAAVKRARPPLLRRLADLVRRQP